MVRAFFDVLNLNEGGLSDGSVNVVTDGTLLTGSSRSTGVGPAGGDVAPKFYPTGSSFSALLSL